jgi:hypothetical protein
MEKSKDNSSSKKKKKNDQSMRGLANTLSSKKTPFSQFVTSLYF